MKIRHLFLLVLGLFIFRLSGLAQKNLAEVDLKRIPYKKVKYYLKNQQKNLIASFDDLKPSCTDEQDLSGYRVVEKTYLIKQKLCDVWKIYSSVSPIEVWNGKIVSFGFMYSRKNNAIVYRNDKYQGVENGQILYLNMKLLKGLYNLALAFEVIKVDSVSKIIEFSYVTQGKARGLQKIQLVETPEGYTRIIHITYFRSNSRFRDKALYPHFHKKAITEFHNNIKRKFPIRKAC